MQKWLDNIDILIYSIHEKGRSVVAERFTRTLKGKFYKIMTANNTKSYLNYLNKLIDEYNNTYHGSVGKKSIQAYYSVLKMN